MTEEEFRELSYVRACHYAAEVAACRPTFDKDLYDRLYADMVARKISMFDDEQFDRIKGEIDESRKRNLT